MQFFLYNIGNWRSQTGVHSTHAVAMERIWKWGHLSGIFFVVPLHFFGSKSTISRTGERFCDGQYGFVNFLFAVLLLAVPPPVTPCQPFVKGRARGARVPPCPMESAPQDGCPRDAGNSKQGGSPLKHEQALSRTIVDRAVDQWRKRLRARTN